MSHSDSRQDMSFDELRNLLIEKRRSLRKERLKDYQKTGIIRNINNQPETGNHFRTSGKRLPEQSRMIMDKSSRKKSWFDHVLLAIEICAVAGFLVILYQGFFMVRNLNRDVSSALAQPTMTPTALISAVVLPSGHTPPNSPKGVQPNEAEIPEHLQPLVQSLALIPVPTSGPQQAVRIQINSINVDAPVVQGDSWEQLKKGVGQHIGTPNPGNTGNIVLSAHNDIFGEIFRDLDQLEPGDEITLFSSTHTYTYIVSETQVVEPTQIEVMSPSQEALITLISCYPYMVDDKRIAVKAYLQE